jgi:hypothetical protein
MAAAIYWQQKVLSHFPVCCWIDWLLMIKYCLIESGPPCISREVIIKFHYWKLSRDVWTVITDVCLNNAVNQTNWCYPNINECWCHECYIRRAMNRLQTTPSVFAGTIRDRPLHVISELLQAYLGGLALLHMTSVPQPRRSAGRLWYAASELD